MPSRPSYLPELGRRLRELRTHRGLTQAEVAERAGITPSYVCLLEHGRNRRVSIEVLLDLSQALGYPLMNLLRESGIVEKGSGKRAALYDAFMEMAALFPEDRLAEEIERLRILGEHYADRPSMPDGRRTRPRA